jgi:hypothetical protein
LNTVLSVYDRRVTGAPIRRARREAERSMREQSLLAQLMAEDRRHPWEVLLDAVHTHDVMMRVQREEVLAAPNPTAVMLQELDHRATVVVTSSRMAIAEKAHEHIALSWRQHVEIQGKWLLVATEAVIDALVLGLDPRHAQDVRVCLLAAARDRLLAEDDDPPEPPPLPFRLAIAPAIEGEVDDDDAADAEAATPVSAGRPRPCHLSSFTDDELAAEIERRYPTEGNDDGG